MALIRPLAWEPPYAVGKGLEKAKRPKQKKINDNNFSIAHTNVRLREVSIETVSEISRFSKCQIGNLKIHGENTQYFIITINRK